MRVETSNRLFGEVVDDFDDFACHRREWPRMLIISAEDWDRLWCVEPSLLLHGWNPVTTSLGDGVDIEQTLRIGDALNGSDHLVDGGGGFRDAGSLNLRVLHDVLHVDAHLVHGAGDFFNCGRGWTLTWRIISGPTT